MTKKITKRIFVLLLAAMLVFPLISCGGKTPEANEPTPATPVSPEPSTVVLPEDTSQEVDCTFLMVYPDTFTYENTPVAAKWLCTEEDIARERTAMEEQLKYE